MKAKKARLKRPSEAEQVWILMARKMRDEALMYFRTAFTGDPEYMSSDNYQYENATRTESVQTQHENALAAARLNKAADWSRKPPEPRFTDREQAKLIKKLKESLDKRGVAYRTDGWPETPLEGP